MPTASDSASAGSSWLIFAALTFLTWGLYGPILHSATLAMKDPINGRFKAFLFVGLAYFLVAVLAPAGMLLMRKAEWTFPTSGWSWSLFAGVLGAVGAFSLLLAFGAKGPPNVVMSIVFAGAPIITALYVLITHPPKDGWSAIKWPFVLGIFLAAAGGCLVALYRPDAAPVPTAAPVATIATEAGGTGSH